ncbi:MAG: hypothetical protein ABIT01_20395 [Thermoanaerobaculia bacterium]
MIVPPDAAARRYEEGRDAVLHEDYPRAIRDLNECLAMGYIAPEQRLGRSRSFVERYDPNYWLGRAYMETGDELHARTHLERSKETRLIEGWPEYSDLVLRLTTLDQRDARRVLAAREARAPVPTPVPAAPAETSAPRPEPREAIAVVRTAPAEPGPVSTPAAAPSDAVHVLSAEESALLKKTVAALAAANWSGADTSVKQLRALNPELLQPDLLDAVIGGTRYLLEGRRNAELLQKARRSLGSFRKRGGNRRIEVFWISPALEALFEG